MGSNIPNDVLMSPINTGGGGGSSSSTSTSTVPVVQYFFNEINYLCSYGYCRGCDLDIEQSAMVLTDCFFDVDYFYAASLAYYWNQLCGHPSERSGIVLDVRF